MILNKSAVERGLAHATMLKTETVDLSKESGRTLPGVPGYCRTCNTCLLLQLQLDQL